MLFILCFSYKFSLVIFLITYYFLRNTSATPLNSFANYVFLLFRGSRYSF
jgi:hypothetical protein